MFRHLQHFGRVCTDDSIRRLCVLAIGVCIPIRRSHTGDDAKDGRLVKTGAML